MADITQIQVGSTTYDIKDANAVPSTRTIATLPLSGNITINALNNAALVTHTIHAISEYSGRGGWTGGWYKFGDIIFVQATYTVATAQNANVDRIVGTGFSAATVAPIFLAQVIGTPGTDCIARLDGTSLYLQPSAKLAVGVQVAIVGAYVR